MTEGFLFIRHGSLAFPKGVFLGSQDVPLSPLGRKQISQQALKLRGEYLDSLTALVSSDLKRCRESAAILVETWAKELPLEFDPNLREISLGAFEGLSKEEVKKKWPLAYERRGLHLETFVPLGGESFEMLKRRVFFSLDYWSKVKRKGLLGIVTHAGVLRVILAHYLALPLKDIWRLPLPYGCYFRLPTWPLDGNNDEELKFESF
ncbi:MAG: histidine phosphatase family protein [Desulfovibrionaceae bacterium]|nr:histidine phosphatase family protein [Desulfovibrionaceae bacterium]